VSKIKTAAKPQITGEQLAKAKEYVVSGGTIEAIKTKYNLSANQLKELTTL
jgi:hypothetical protein